ncbi:MAG: M23 family metallopeptidase [bacterium]|nr:M23 family metallopeptidase [bacterium]
MGGIALLSLTGFGDAPEANEVETVRRSGDVGQYEPIPIESLPVHHSADAPIVADHQRAALDPELRQAATRKSAARRPTAPRMPAPKASRADAGVDLMTSPLGLSVIKGKLSRGQSIAGVLRRRGISPQMVRMIDRALRPEFDFRRAQPGDSFRLSRDMDGRLVSFRYRASPDESFVLRQSPRGYVVERVESVLYRRMTRMEGTVDSSLYKSIRGLGHDPGLASAFADIFAWDIDFTRQLKRGDGFTILYEQLYREEDGAEVYVRPGRILAAQFRGAVGEHTAVYFEENSGAGSYFRPDGETLEQEFLAAPLKFSRISSRYSSARNHPILKVVRPHHGIDYAARQGSPVWSVAEGEVIFRGRNGGFGNLVKVRHAGGYVSYYAHLSAFGQGLEAGQKVKQKQVIGYVGQTGLATGPHVCFRVTKHGNYVNPATLNHSKPVLRSVADASWSEFEMVRDQLLANLESGRLVDVAAGSPL